MRWRLWVGLSRPEGAGGALGGSQCGRHVESGVGLAHGCVARGENEEEAYSPGLGPRWVGWSSLLLGWEK